MLLYQMSVTGIDCVHRHLNIYVGYYNVAQHNTRAHVISGSYCYLKTVTGISIAGAFGIGTGIWYLKKVRAKASVICGVQSNENRFFCLIYNSFFRKSYVNKFFILLYCIKFDLLYFRG
ncbi:hypothetical protein AHAS_Ahas09G0148900 [Arachis hypogaea]